MNRDYSEKVSAPYRGYTHEAARTLTAGVGLGGMPEEYPGERAPYPSMTAKQPADLTSLETIEQSLIRAHESCSAIQYALTALHARIHGPQPETAYGDLEAVERADGTLNRVYQRLADLHAMIDRIDRVKNELVNLA